MTVLSSCFNLVQQEAILLSRGVTKQTNRSLSSHSKGVLLLARVRLSFWFTMIFGTLDKRAQKHSVGDKYYTGRQRIGPRVMLSRITLCSVKERV